MAFWWVNHKQTHIHEIEGGYIWSPFKNKDGRSNVTYLNLTYAAVGDKIFSYADGKIKAVGVVTRLAVEGERPAEFGKAGDAWSIDGWKVLVRWSILDFPFSPKVFWDEISSMFPEKYSPLQKNGNGNQAFYLASIPDPLGWHLLGIIRRCGMDLPGIKHEVEMQDAYPVYQLKTLDIPSTTRQQLVNSRVGQGVFRENVERIEPRCRVTGVDSRNLLIASHIKPWRWSDNKERLDGNNGLLLSPHVDKLFDKGWITFGGDGAILVASDDIRIVLSVWGIDPSINVGGFNGHQRKYMGFHFENVFKLRRPLWE